MQIAIVGSGYVGLVTGACFAEFGYHVTCVDKDVSKIENLCKGIIPIYEPGLESLVQQTQKVGRLSFTTDLKEAVSKADAVFIAVGTPSRRGDGHADLSYVYAAAEEIGQALEGYTVVVTKSTVPVGTCRKVSEIISQTLQTLQSKAEFDVASNPEFLREGSAINDFMRPDRVVIGTQSDPAGHDRARAVLQQLYRPLYLIETPLVFTGIETAELIKYAANGFLAMKIAFINEMADVCEQVDANIQDLAKAIGLDGRIGRKFLHVGPGYGGSCFPKDTLALTKTARDKGAPTSIIESVVKSNDDRKKAMANKVVQALDGPTKGKTIAVLGVTFKPNTDDMRDAPSLTIIPALQEAGLKIQAYDPVGREEAEKHLSNISWAKSAYEAMKGADAVLILTEWNEFRALDFGKMAGFLSYPLLIDLRNIYRPEEMIAAGFDYVSIGRPTIYGAELASQRATSVA
ncbi:MAG: UDP-glucose/GDP-mannose dehydrogenase family protein [Alphaproteobacteria bacterium]|jgi:UDPglucose 6-dehydrogenase|nr:UDP-glucose/GDP-mannose dehydrogenase family protein [Alphaproteobacteria bacterium]